MTNVSTNAASNSKGQIPAATTSSSAVALDAVSDAEVRRLFLKSRDVSCPRCHFNLRGVTGDKCPECGEAIQLAVKRKTLGRAARWMALVLTSWVLAINGLAVRAQYSFVSQYYRASLGEMHRYVKSARERVDKLEAERTALLAAGPEQSEFVDLEEQLTNEQANLSELEQRQRDFPKTLVGYWFHGFPGVRWMSALAVVAAAMGSLGMLGVALAKTRQLFVMAVVVGTAVPAALFTVLLVFYVRLI